MVDSLGDRMKEYYENVTRYYLPKRTNLIIRLDGRAFHTLTKRCDKPFDRDFIDSMEYTLGKLCRDISGVKFGYVQSDEISLLLTDYDTLLTQQWFGGNIQKIVSVSASIATQAFNDFWMESCYKTNPGTFDSRVFTIPEQEEVINYFIWRQKDWNRNSLNMLASTHFSAKQLEGKNSEQRHDMLHEIGVNWNDCKPEHKNGSIAFKIDEQWRVEAAPTFTLYREIIRDRFPRNENIQ